MACEAEEGKGKGGEGGGARVFVGSGKEEMGSYTKTGVKEKRLTCKTWGYTKKGQTQRIGSNKKGLHTKTRVTHPHWGFAHSGDLGSNAKTGVKHGHTNTQTLH